MNEDARVKMRQTLLRLRAEMLDHLDRTAEHTRCCTRCLLPYLEHDFEAYYFFPWCSLSINGRDARIDESRKIIEHERYGNDEIQCGECGGEYEQPTKYSFQFCPHCGAPFAAQDEMLIELPFLVGAADAFASRREPRPG